MKTIRETSEPSQASHGWLAAHDAPPHHGPPPPAHPWKPAKGLQRQPPRRSRLRVGRYAILARRGDTGRALLQRTARGYHCNSPVANLLFAVPGAQGADIKP